MSVSIVHCLYSVGIWNSLQTIPDPCSSGDPSSHFLSFETLANSPSTSSSVGIMRSVSAGASGHSVCMQHHQNAALIRCIAVMPEWFRRSFLIWAFTPPSIALLVDSHTPPSSPCSSTNVNMVPSLTRRFRMFLALRRRSRVYCLLPSFKVNSRKKRSHLAHQLAYSASHAAAVSASFASRSFLASEYSPRPQSSFGLVVAHLLTGSKTWKRQRCMRVVGQIARRLGGTGRAVGDCHRRGRDSKHKRRPRLGAFALRQVPCENMSSRARNEDDGVPGDPDSI